MAEEVRTGYTIGKRAQAVLWGSLFIAALSWGHFFVNQFVDTGVPSNAPIGAFAVALATSMILYQSLQGTVHGKKAVVWALLVVNFLATSALQLLAVHLFA